jgi:predicted nucleotidyltransferase
MPPCSVPVRVATTAPTAISTSYPAARVTMYDYVDIKEYIEGLFGQPVDVVNRDGLRPLVRPRATADAIYAF